MRRLVPFLLLPLLACAEREVFAPGDADVLVVDAVLFVGDAYPDLWLRRTGAGDSPYDALASGETGATVRIQDGANQVTYRPALAPGRYTPPDGAGTIQPGTTYELRITTQRGETLTARTTTPSQVAIADWLLLEADGATVRRELATFVELGDAVFDAPTNQLFYTDGLLEARFLGDIHDVGYQVSVRALEPDEFVIDTSGLDDEDLEDFDSVGTSPIFSGEDRFFRLPWFAIAYAGRHVIRIYAVDDNWRSLVTNVPEIYDGGGNFGGNIGDGVDRPDFAVEGGIGLFGSASVDSIGFRVLPNE